MKHIKTNIIILTLGFIFGVISYKPLCGYFNPVPHGYDTRGMTALVESVQPIDALEGYYGKY